MLPEFSEFKIITHEFHVMKGSPDFPYDMVLGQDVISELGINLDFESQQIKWGQLGVDMKEPNFIRKDQRSFTFYKSTEPKAVREDTKRATRILDANYEKANLPNIVKECSHLNKEEQNKLLEVLDSYQDLFDGTLGDFNTKPVHIEIKPDATPYHGKAYQVPHVHEAVLKKEVERLVQIGVLRKSKGIPWASPTFIIPKKNNTV